MIFRRLFSKRCTFGSKSGTKSSVRRYQGQAKFSKTVYEHLKVCHIWLTKNPKNNLSFSYICYSHNSIRPFHSEYSPFFTCYTLVDIHTQKYNWIMWKRNITKHKVFFNEPNMTDLQMFRNRFWNFWPGIDVPKI